mgnify:CR=1 FL=1
MKAHAELEGKIPALQIIDPKSVDAGERIVFGATVGLYDEDDDVSVTYQIVGDDEADIKENRISVSSPIARALIGKYEGDSVQFMARRDSSPTKSNPSSTSDPDSRS